MSLENLSTTLGNYLANRSLASVLALCIACFILAGVFRMIFGKKGVAVKSISVLLDLLLLYSIAFILYFQLPAFSKYQTPLPFLTIFNDHITFLSMTDADRLLLCVHLVHLIILTFFFALTEDLLPKGKRLLPWLLLRAVSLTSVYILYSILCWASNAFLPGFIVNYAPMILLILLAIFLAVTIFKWLIGLILGISGGPIIGAIYTFFVSNIIGKQLTKAALSCGLFVGLLYCLDWQGLSALYFNNIATTTLIICIAILLIVRYLTSKLF